MSIILLIAGFILLIKGADIFVDGACAVARLLGLPTMLIGLTVVAFGTSAPELSVSISAAIRGSNEIVLGNVVGSNLVNLLFIGGISAVIAPFSVKSSMIKRDYPFMIFSGIILAVMTLSDREITRFDGMILLAAFAFLMRMLLKDGTQTAEDKEKPRVVRAALFTMIGLAAVILGGHIVVSNAEILARKLGMSESFIGLTIIAIGTSLPELVTSVTAARKGESDLAIGNIVGSNLFNILLILGVSSVITEIQVETAMLEDILILTISGAVFFAPILLKKRISRLTGVCMVLTYCAYAVWLLMMGR